MKKAFFSLLILLAISSQVVCTASDTTAKGQNDLGKSVANAMQTVREEAEKAGTLIMSWVNSLGKQDQNSDKSSNTHSTLQKDASNTFRWLGREVDEAGHTISNSLKSVDNRSTNEPTEKSAPTQNGAENSQNNFFDGLRRNLNKAGKSINDFAADMGKQASQQWDRAKQQIEKTSDKPNTDANRN